VPKKWQEIRRTAIAEGRIEEAGVSAQRERLEGEMLAYRLAEIRKAQGVSQEQLAKTMGVTQSRVSRIESGDISRAELSTLAAYVRALGGVVRVVAEFKDEQVVIT